MYRVYLGGFLMPVTPGKIETTVNGRNETVTLINEGEVNILKSPGLTDINIPDLMLPVKKYPFSNDVAMNWSQDGVTKFTNGTDPDFYLGFFERWKVMKQFIQFKVIRTSPDDKKILFTTQMDVTVEDYHVVEDAEEGGDLIVELNLKQYKAWGAKKLKITSKNKTPKPTNPRKPRNKDTKKYTIKDGDTLKKIARKLLNDGSLWEKIYKTNKKTIEAAAKKNGRASSSNGVYLYAGTILKINMKDAVTGGCAGNGNMIGEAGGGGGR